MKKSLLALPLLSLLALPLLAGPAPADPWAGWQFLFGQWETVATKAGEGSGRFSLGPDLDGKVLVRRNHAEYPASNGRPASVHDDLMIVHPDPAGGPARAVYFDNEGHVIHYTVRPSTPGTLVLLSETQPGTPRFRLTYFSQESGTVKVRFEMAPSGEEKDLKLYLEGEVRKVAPPGGGK